MPALLKHGTGARVTEHQAPLLLSGSGRSLHEPHTPSAARTDVPGAAGAAVPQSIVGSGDRQKSKATGSAWAHCHVLAVHNVLPV